MLRITVVAVIVVNVVMEVVVVVSGYRGCGAVGVPTTTTTTATTTTPTTTTKLNYQFRSCLTFLHAPGVICVAIDSVRPTPGPLSGPVGCFPAWPTLEGAAVLNF